MFGLIRLLFGLGANLWGFLFIAGAVFFLVVSCQQDLEKNGITPLYKEFEKQLAAQGEKQ